MIAAYTYDGVGRPLSMYQPATGATYYFHFNAHGDVVALTDATAKIVATYTYDPWGRVTLEWYASSIIRNPFRYGGAYGYYYDTETGMYYLQARYYKPDIYRFISKDPVQGDLKDPMSLNPYTYCADNPVNMVDPDGENPLVIAGVTGVSIPGIGWVSLGIIAAYLGVSTIIIHGIPWAKEKYRIYKSEQKEGKELVRKGSEILGRSHNPERAKRWNEWYQRLSKRQKELYRKQVGQGPESINSIRSCICHISKAINAKIYIRVGQRKNGRQKIH